ncbi:hypothetical protein NEHOM01_1807 [Nematocida homosporus]|uniref:uncharacterized protein n=1 Tax=Nematocida homosporus TaxID=1912981 RepID=UPI00221E3ED8|nr:uncharacterized protein NEHOM01_1807 [Nematocida homosporus]KAI5186923.1 hypothetical protein NEHOM01_1807 [Nematocida homosporus]
MFKGKLCIVFGLLFNELMSAARLDPLANVQEVYIDLRQTSLDRVSDVNSIIPSLTETYIREGQVLQPPIHYHMRYINRVNYNNTNNTIVWTTESSNTMFFIWQRLVPVPGIPNQWVRVCYFLLTRKARPARYSGIVQMCRDLFPLSCDTCKRMSFVFEWHRLGGSCRRLGCIDLLNKAKIDLSQNMPFILLVNLPDRFFPLTPPVTGSYSSQFLEIKKRALTAAYLFYDCLTCESSVTKYAFQQPIEPFGFDQTKSQAYPDETITLHQQRPLMNAYYLILHDQIKAYNVVSIAQRRKPCIEHIIPKLSTRAGKEFTGYPLLLDKFLLWVPDSKFWAVKKEPGLNLKAREIEICCPDWWKFVRSIKDIKGQQLLTKLIVHLQNKEPCASRIAVAMVKYSPFNTVSICINTIQTFKMPPLDQTKFKMKTLLSEDQWRDAQTILLFTACNRGTFEQICLLRIRNRNEIGHSDFINDKKQLKGLRAGVDSKALAYLRRG